MNKKERRLYLPEIRLNTILKDELKDKFVDIAKWLGLEYGSNTSIITTMINLMHRELNKPPGYRLVSHDHENTETCAWCQQINE